MLENKILNEILAVDSLEGITVGQYAEKVKEILKPLRESETYFPHGFESWLKSYSEFYLQITFYKKSWPKTITIDFAKKAAHNFEATKTHKDAIIDDSVIEKMIEAI